MKIALYSRTTTPQHESCVLQLVERLQRRAGVEVLLHEPFYRSLSQPLHGVGLFAGAKSLPPHVACLMSIGGDGTFLDAASIVAGTDVPLVGVSAGRLGFLASVTIDKSEEAINDILAGKFTVERRNFLRVEGCPDGLHYALNEVCLQKRGAAIAEINVHVNGEFLNSYWADGLIVATPTGSTAYSLSAGGPLVAPNAECMIISPIAPHNLSVRPIVIPDTAEVVLEMMTRSGSVIVGVDSRSYELPAGAKLKVQKATTQVGFVKFSDSSFFQTLRSKLKWGLDARG
ncbi:MAG: NAD(+)/NADH kinase [Prevotellaceae bacterium]|nr:NAD(+)/NADH kinase [Prevotellaceae bacterium]